MFVFVPIFELYIPERADTVDTPGGAKKINYIKY